MTTTMSKEAQEQEAKARSETNGVPPGETAAATAAVPDTPQDPLIATPPPPPAADTPAPREAPAPAPMSAFDQKRAAITKNYRETRLQEITTAQQDDGVSRQLMDNTPEDFRQASAPQQPEPQPQGDVQAPAAADAAAPAPKLPPVVRLTVNGQEKEYTLEDALKKAQIAVASEDILEQAKTRARELDTILADVRTRAAHAPGASPNQAGDPNNVQNATGSPQVPKGGPANQGADLDKLIESIQFGAPEDVKPLLEQTIQAMAQPIVQKQLMDARLADEGARTAKVLKDFEEKHSDIASDKRARAAIEQDMLELQAEDLRAIGVDPLRVRPDGLPSTPGDIAMAHRWYRAQGLPSMRSPESMLETALGSFMEWKGARTEPAAPNAPPAQPAQPAPKAPPRIEVSVDREERRAAIPQQPSRSAAPPRQMPQQTEVAVGDRRSQVAIAEQQRRRAMRGGPAVSA